MPAKSVGGDQQGRSSRIRKTPPTIGEGTGRNMLEKQEGEKNPTMFDITASVVVYKNPLDQVQQVILSFLSTQLKVKLYVVDNSPDDGARSLCIDPRIVYVFNGRNLGFGAGHNIALRLAMNQAAYHAILNPDIYFGPGVLEALLDFAQRQSDVGLLMPKILNPDGSFQYLCKRLPSPTDLVLRRFLPALLEPFFKDRLARYELRDQDYTRVLSVPILSGCFMLISSLAVTEVGVFDERYFMYLEDVDLCRRIHQKFKTIYFPAAAVYHRNAKGSYREAQLLMHHIRSAFRYFQKWGWYFDPERDRINQKVMTSAVVQQQTIPEH
jgi:GT2 family glycosyltransferase